MSLKGIAKPENLAFLILSLVSIFLVKLTDGNNKEVFLIKAGVRAFSSVQATVGEGVRRFYTTFASFKELLTLKEDYSKAQEELVGYYGVERELTNLKRENAQLRALLELSSRVEHQTTAADIIARDPENFFSAIIINKGQKDGIEKNMPVIAYDEQQAIFGLVGRIIEVHGSSSRLLPVFDKNSHIAALLEKSAYQGLVSGTGKQNGSLRMNYVSRDARLFIEEGDLVTTSGFIRPGRREMQSNFPQGLYLGRVDKVIASDSNISLSLELDSVVDFARLNRVFVLTSKAQEEIIVSGEAG